MRVYLAPRPRTMQRKAIIARDDWSRQQLAYLYLEWIIWGD